MTKYYIGFGLVAAAVLGLAIYGIAEQRSHHYQSPLEQARSKSLDARRLADIRQIMTGLELFYNDCGNYPSTLSADDHQNCPEGITMGDYLPSMPLNPSPGGTPYTYQSSSPYTSYTLTFTLEQATGGFAAGLHTASPEGLE